MRKNIAKVLEAFANRRPAKGDSKNTCSTDGETVFSYTTPIASYSKQTGRVLVLRYDLAPSNTTRAQVMAITYATAKNQLLAVPDFYYCHEHDDCVKIHQTRKDCDEAHRMAGN